MKKAVCILLSVLLLLFVFVSCDKTCEHEFSDGACVECGEDCTHTFENGKCSICNQECAHKFENAKCSICGYSCSHVYENGVCSVCNEECLHSMVKGVCQKCNMIQLSKADLRSREFEYSYFELAWSETVTESQKEALRKSFNTESDDGVIDKLYDEYRQYIMAFKSFMIDGYKFQNGNAYASKGGTYSSGKNFSVKDNAIIIGEEKLYYEGDKIYSIGDSEDYKGISIKMVFVEK